MLYISWFSLQLPLYWLSLLLPRTLKNKSNFTFNCPLKFLLLCPVLIFGLNHIQLFRESESSLKFLISVLGLSLCWHQSLFILMMIIIIGNVITVLTCFLRWRWFSSEQKSRIFLWDQASRRPGRAGLGQPAELSSTTGKNVNTDTEQSPALAALNPPSLCRVKDGTKMWKFPDKSTHGGLPPSHDHMSNVTLGKPEKLYARPASLYGGYKIRGWGFQDTHQDLITLGWLLKTHDHSAPIFYALIHFGDLLTDQVTCHITLSWFI